MAFLRDGCSVSAVCPPGHPLRFVKNIRPIYGYRSVGTVRSLEAAIRSVQPVLIVPCDDCAIWQLHELHSRKADLRPLIELSLGAPEAYSTIQRRDEVLRIADELGIRVPYTRCVNSAEELQDWDFDEPAVLKLDGTCGGEGVTIVRALTEAIQAFRSARGATAASVAWKRYLIDRNIFALWPWLTRKQSKIIIQKFIPGRPATTMFACWRGEVLASVTVEVLASKGATGAASIVRVLKNGEIEEAARRLAQKFQLSGFHGLDFILERGTGAVYMLELNPRATQLGHLNLSSRGDLAGVIAAQLGCKPPLQVNPMGRIQENVVAFFPGAFKENPRSPYLNKGYHDVPWEEPELIRELARDTWPERRWLSRIYHYFRLRKEVKLERDALRPVHLKPHLWSEGPEALHASHEISVEVADSSAD
jgi:hypothetical protein